MCVHHWIIDSRNYGICKKCGEEQDFDWEIPKPNKTEMAMIRALKPTDFYYQGHIEGHTQGIKR